MDTSDKRVRQILALLEKTTKNGATPEEAEAAFAAAQRLMTKFAIDEALLRAARGGRGADDPVVTDTSVKVKGSYRDASVWMWQGVAEANDCRVFIRTNYDRTNLTTVVIVGHRSDIEHVLVLGTQLALQLARELRACRPTYDEWDRRSKGMQAYVYRRSFAEGWVRRIGQRLKDARHEVITEADEGKGTLLPALLDRAGEVDSWVDEHFPNLVTRTTRRRSYSLAGAGAGVKAANRADIGQSGVRGSRGALKR